MSVQYRRLSDRAKMLLTLAFAALACLYVLSAGGCDFGKAEVVKETSEPHFLRGQEELRRGNISEALSAFLKVSEKRRDAPESHFELGRIYLEHMNDPNTAIYHFKKYLELKPNSPSSPMVRQMIETAQKKFAASLPESPFDSNIRRIELEEILQKQQKENLELKQKLAAAIATIDRLEATQNVRVEPRAQRRSAVATASSNSSETASVNATASAQQRQAEQPRRAEQTAQNSASARVPTVSRDIPSTYVVQAGDTLSSISRKIYGTPNKWRDIFSANRDRLATASSLKPGQTLKIPRR